MKVLLIEDNPADERLVRASLGRASADLCLTWCTTLQAALEHLATEGADVVLADLCLPDSRGVETVERLTARAEDVAIVVLTDLDDEDMAVRSLQAGAQDYLVKGLHEPALLRRVLRYATERKRAEQQVRQLNAELESRVERRTRELALANRELEAFAYSVSHDLQAPLRTIGGFAELLAMDYASSLDPEARLLIERMRQASQHMGDLLEALLDLSRVSRHTLRPQAIDLAVVAENVVRELRAGAPERTVHAEVCGNLQVVGDPRLMEIAIRNLLNNAWKFTRRTPGARVRIAESEPLGERVFAVSDNGVGFDAEFAARLFEPFQRLHRAQDFEGTGIGLATVQRIIQRHGGRIWAESAPGQGAVFSFTLPTDLPTPLPQTVSRP